MNDYALIWPMFAMVLLVLFVLLRLFRARATLVKQGDIAIAFYKTCQGATEPEKPLQLARSFTNQFEAPVLFYVACLAALIVQTSNTILVVLAWAYVVCRAVHIYVHTGSNRIRTRVQAYFAGWFVLLCMWAMIVASTIVA